MLHLARIKGENFRLFKHLELNLHPRFNLVVGQNAAGKTSFLEAVYCLGRAKSFRGNSPSELAGKEGRHWSVKGRFSFADAPGEDVTVHWQPEGMSIKQGHHQAGTITQLVKAWPIQVIEPAMHRLLQDGPGYRRSFLDWGVFHVEQGFYPQWRRNQRALRQRNKALRQKAAPKEISIWDPELAETAVELNAFRSAHLQNLQPQLDRYISDIFGDARWSADLYPGWPADMTYSKVLRQQIDRDRRMGMTVEGAHRAELRIKLDRHQVKNRISRGQQKLLISALILSQARLIHLQTGRAPILLVDDFAAELATEFQGILLQMLTDYPGQIFLTAFERNKIFDAVGDFNMFHVEHGQITQC